MIDNSVIKLLSQHRSIRRFKVDPIAEETLDILIKAGQSASSSSFIQATTVVRVCNAADRHRLAELSGNQPYVSSSPEFLVFCADLHRNQQRISKKVGGNEPEFGWTEQFLAATVDVALFAQNVVVAAESLGLGCCYIGGIRNNPDEVDALLELPSLVYPIFGLCLGYPGQSPLLKPRLPCDVVLHQDRYQPESRQSETIDRYDETVKDYYRSRTKGKLEHSWSEQMAEQSATQSRPFMQAFLNRKGFARK